MEKLDDLSKFNRDFDGTPLHRQHIFVGGRLLGSRDVRPFQTNGGEFAKFTSVVYVCPVCGEVWARTIFDLVPTHTPSDWNDQYVAALKPCYTHGAGYILSGPELDYLEDFPNAVLKYEFLRRYHVITN